MRITNRVEAPAGDTTYHSWPARTRSSRTDSDSEPPDADRKIPDVLETPELGER
jgi:hypothetical protein